MKILSTNNIDTVSTDGGELSATSYPDDNVLTDAPRQPYLATAGSTQVVFTVNLSANSDAFFVYNWLADVLEYSTDGGSGYTTLSSAGENYLSDNDELWKNNQIITKPIFTEVAMATTNDLRLRLQATVDRKDSPIGGNAIANWNQIDGDTGNFEDSVNATININDHGRVMLGGSVTIGGTDYIISKIIGDGTTSGAITLASAPVDGAITALYNPIRIGIVRVGDLITIENATALRSSLKDYSVRRFLSNGGVSTKNRNIARILDISMFNSYANSDTFKRFYHGFRAKPFPALVLNGMPSAQDEDVNYSGFFEFLDGPSENLLVQGKFKDSSFQLLEVL